MLKILTKYFKLIYLIMLIRINDIYKCFTRKNDYNYDDISLKIINLKVKIIY